MKLLIVAAMLSVFLTFTWTIPVMAQKNQATTLSMSLKQAQDYAIKNNANSRNSSIDMEIAKKKIWETTAIGLPQVNAQGNYQHLFTVPSMSLGVEYFLKSDLPAGTPIMSEDIGKHVSLGYSYLDPVKLGVANNTTLDITVSQLIFSGEYIVGLQATKVYYEMTNQNKLKTEQDLRESVANAYTLALVLEQTRAVLTKSLENTKKTLADMKQMLQQGLVENTDVDQIELVSLNLANGVNSMNRQVDATYDLIKYQIGMNFSDKLMLTDNLDNLAGTVNLEAISTTPFKINNNLDYQILQTSETIGYLNLKREKSTCLPNLAAVYRHTEKVVKPAFDFNPKDVFQISMNIPIFSSGQRNVKVQQRQMELQKIVNTKENVANGLELQFVNARNDLNTAYDKLLNDKKNIELTKRIYDKTLIKFGEGVASSREITDNLNQYLTAQSNMYNSMMSVITAKNKLDKLNNNL